MNSLSSSKLVFSITNYNICLQCITKPRDKQEKERWRCCMQFHWDTHLNLMIKNHWIVIQANHLSGSVFAPQWTFIWWFDADPCMRNIQKKYISKYLMRNIYILTLIRICIMNKKPFHIFFIAILSSFIGYQMGFSIWKHLQSSISFTNLNDVRWWKIKLQNKFHFHRMMNDEIQYPRSQKHSPNIMSLKHCQQYPTNPIII